MANFISSFNLGGVPTPTFGSSIANFGGVGAPQGQQGLIGLLQALLGAITQLGQGWNSFGGGGYNPQQFGGNQPFAPYNPQQSFGGYNPNDSFSVAGAYGSGQATPGAYTGGTGGGSYGGTIGAGTTASPDLYTQLPPSRDSQDFASYLQAQLAGGTLSGGTSISQADAIQGSRFARVQSPQLWHADVARNYAYQFAAFAGGYDPLSVGGLQGGVNAFHQMNPESRLFMQVASVFKGNNFNGPGFYDNAGLKNLLIQKGAGDLASLGGVGQTDVQTIGAVAKAIDRGQLSLQDIINSGTISDLNRYATVIDYVQTGRFALDLNAYDNVAL
ncbi:MAG: hypothetical protein AB7S38_09185 [Vulcanimicrobiota bacterium]